MFERILIIGGGVAAMRFALELRSQGYDGRIRIVSSKTTPPYDRTQLAGGEIAGRPGWFVGPTLFEGLDDGVPLAQEETFGPVVNSPTTGAEVYVPVGGVKASGWGPHEQGRAAIDFYTETVTVYEEA